MSSETIAFTALGTDYRYKNSYPSDPDDFSRCLKLCNECPGIKQYLPKVAEISPVWKAIINNWFEIEKCFVNEVGVDWSKGRDLHATKTYALMRKIINDSK